MNTTPSATTPYASTASLVREDRRNNRGRVVYTSMTARSTAYAVREVIVTVHNSVHKNVRRVIFA